MKPKNLSEMQQKAILLICKILDFCQKEKKINVAKDFLCFFVIKGSFLESVF